MRHARWAIALTAALATFAAAAEPQSIDPVIAAAVDSPDRPQADKDRDAGRRPAIVLQFFGVRPGMRVLEYIATGGNTAELLSRVVGPKGKVYMQNPPSFFERGGEKQVAERLANNRLPNVVRVDKPVNQLGLKANSLDGAVMNLVFHDMFWQTQDVPGVLRDLYAALKPGGFVGVVDHAAPAGTGDTYATNRQGQHRIDEDFARRMFLDAGFVLEAESQALRNPDDDRTKPFFAPEMKDKLTDRFMLRFRKPKQ